MVTFSELPADLEPVHAIAVDLDAQAEKLKREGAEAGGVALLADRLHTWLDGQRLISSDTVGEG
jgi:hypothetical protein